MPTVLIVFVVLLWGPLRWHPIKPSFRLHSLSNEKMIGFLKNVHKTTQFFCATTSVLLNSTLIGLIIFKSPKSIGFYKYLMIYISLFEAVYSILDVSAEPIIFSHGSAFIALTNVQNSFLDKSWMFLVIIIYAGCFGFSLALFAVHFLYRYSIIRLSFGGKLLHGSKKQCLFVIPLIYGFWWTYLCSLFSPDSENDSYMRKAILDNFNLKMEDLTYVCFLFYRIDHKGISTPNLKAFIAILCMMFMILTSMFCVLYFGVNCYKVMNHAFLDKPNESVLTKSLQKQLFYALVIQTCIPLVLMYIPAGVLFLTAIFEFPMGSASNIVAITIAIYPAIDPLPNLLIITEYRRAIKQFLMVYVFRNSSKTNNTNIVLNRF
ncbi:unnamed protein product [Caenorhabditis angaria]|uniref:Serpentine receptor class r-10 n=1 Tax=Caenorhabditis angaria TaxID=860376 RepID=A0A9P1J5B2_9PELO|nr:unnamed protein product [Caenorhabditis angaria]